jgi:hypothetical protein
MQHMIQHSSSYCNGSVAGIAPQPVAPVRAEQHQALLVQVAREGVYASHQQPQPDAKLAAVDEQRVGHVALRKHKGLGTGQPARMRCTGW